MKIPSPTEIGLPPKFDKWRNNQDKAISDLLCSGSRFNGLCAPTGFGKSPTYMAYALLSGQPTCIVTNSRGLQDQLMNDFSSIGLVDIRGKSNYDCAAGDDYTCQEGQAARCPYRGTVMCPASKAEMRAAASTLVVTNYDKWMASSRYGTSLQHFTQLVLDEGHDAPDAVARAMQINISDQDIRKTLQLDYPRDVEVFGCWKIWANYAKDTAEERLKQQKYMISTHSNPKSSWIKEMIHIQNLHRKLCILAVSRPDDWVVEEVREMGFQFDPIRPAKYAESTLFRGVPRVVIVSATLRPKTMYMLGVRKENYNFMEFESEFDPRRCPVYWVPTMRVDSRAKDLSPLWVRLDQVISRRQDRKGIVHSVSYSRQQDILATSRYREKMIINHRGIPVTSTIEIFRHANPGSILVSPSVSTGYDFPGRDCEWQFLCKIPFPDGRSKINKARSEDDSEYAPYAAMQTMVQAFGRGMRSKADQCEAFIFDDHLSWFIPKFRHLAPNSFYKTFRKVEAIPAPPERLI